MDYKTFGDIEDFTHGDGKKGEGAELGVIFEIIVGVSAYQDGSTLETGKSLEGGGTVTLGVAPFSLAVEMIVGDHSFPKGGNFVIC